MERARGLAVAVLGVLALLAAILYAIAPTGRPTGAGQVVGLSTSPTPTLRTVLWVGDAYDATTRGGLDPAAVTCAQLDWLCTFDVQVGTGFLAGTSSSSEAQRLVERLTADDQTVGSPAFVVLDVGREDTASAARLTAAVTSYADQLTTTFPHARVVVVAPYDLTSADAFATARAVERAMAAERGWPLVDPVAGGWAPAPQGQQLTTAGTQPVPTAAGARYIAQHLAPLLSAAVASTPLPMSPSAASSLSQDPSPSARPAPSSSARVLRTAEPTGVREPVPTAGTSTVSASSHPTAAAPSSPESGAPVSSSAPATPSEPASSSSP